jgi:pimeloyl-ACP methyl ester carboxylesterase
MDKKPQQNDPEKPFDLSRTVSDLFGSLTRKATRLPAWTYRQIPDHPAFNPLRSVLRVSTVVPRTAARVINELADALEHLDTEPSHQNGIAPPHVHPHRQNKTETAILFIHGFGQNSQSTWGEFPRFIASDRRLDGWDIYSVGYTTSLWVDLAGLWAASPPLSELAVFLNTLSRHAPFDEYKSLAIVAHSMGGLIVQQSLIEDPELRSRVGHLTLFGTPNGGVSEGSLFKFWKSQIGDMAEGGSFITQLRQKWEEMIGETPSFNLQVVAGDEDEFVPASANLDPFPASFRVVIPGNHVSIANPSDPGDLNVQVVTKQLVGEAAPAGPWNSARVAVESRNFQHAIDELWPHRTELDDPNLVLLCLSLESVGREKDAIDLLEQIGREATDLKGTLAGRFKRRWLQEGRLSDAERARELYGQAFSASESGGDASQSFYHGINVAFMELAHKKDLDSAQKMARRVLTHCSKAYKDTWRLATEGEAFLLLGEEDRSIDHYGQALDTNPEPRQISSMFHQATLVSGLLKNQHATDRLEVLFRKRR